MRKLERLGEQRGVTAKAVDGWSLSERMASASQFIEAKIIYENEQNVGTRLWLCDG